MSTFLRQGQMGCWRSLVIQLIAAAIVVPLFCLLIVVPLWLVNEFDMGIGWLIVPAALFLVVLIGGGIGGLFLVTYRRARRQDALFVPLGMTGSLYQMFFRQYHGAVGGRQVSVYLSRGPKLEVDIPTPLQTRLGVTEQDVDTVFLAGLFDRQPMALADHALSGLAAFALDEAWALRLVDQPNVAALLQRLIAFEGFFMRRQVILMPGTLRLLLYGSANLLDFKFDITVDQVRRWIDDLIALASIAESLPAPQITDSVSQAERVAASIRSRNAYLLPLVTIGGILAVFLCSAVAGAAAFLWALAQ